MVLLLNDTLVAGIAFLGAYFIRFYVPLPVFRQDAAGGYSFYLGLIAVILPLWVTVFASTGLYNRENLVRGLREYDLLWRATTTSMMLVIVAGFLEPRLVIARGWLILAWAFSFVLIGLGRFAIRRTIYELHKRGYFLTSTIIVGANEEARLLATQLSRARSKKSGLRLVGFVSDEVPVGTIVARDIPVLGPLTQLDDFVRAHQVEEIIIARSALPSADIVALFKDYGISKTVKLRLSSGLYELVTTGLTIQDVGAVPLMSVNQVRLTGVDQVLKMALDFSITLPGLLALSPLLLGVALAVKLTSPGPLLHRRRVVGVNGKQFDAFKFRTMYVNGDEILTRHPELKAELEKNAKLKDDPRITPIGKFLRRFSIDELLQLFNVLRGEMSLVGPRMIAPGELTKYNQWDINLLTVRPGITGLWQVSGRSDISYEERVLLDMYYIRNWTIWFDLQILARTPAAVFKARGAY